MLIEQPELFKTWLTSVLKPLCDADPAALAKYVLALVRKDKTEEELRKLMVDQLHVFLEDETGAFVTLVLRTLLTHEYLNTPMIPSTNPPNPGTIIGQSQPAVAPSVLTITAPPAPPPPPTVSVEPPAKRERRKSESRRNRISRSRSRSWERSTTRSGRSRSREAPPPSKRPRSWRNKSPPSQSGSRSRRRSRSPRSRNHTRTRSQSASSKSQRASNIQTNSGQTLQDDANSISGGSSKRRCRDFDEMGYCMRGEMCPFDHGIDPVVLEDANLSSVLAYNPNAPVNGGATLPPIQQDGVTLIGAGAPVLATGATNEYNPQAPQIWHRSANTVSSANAASIGAGQLPSMQCPPPPPPPNISLNHAPPSTMMLNRPPGPMLFTQPPPHNTTAPPPPPPPGIPQRELIHVPVIDAVKSAAQFGNGPTSNGAGGGIMPYQGHNHNVPPPSLHHITDGPAPKRRMFDFSRLGARPHHHSNFRGNTMMGGGSGTAPNAFQQNRSSLILKKVPASLNTITHLNNHFSRFGKTINIQVQYEGDPEAAIVTFSSHAEANAAYRSTEAVLNNRFIKVFWFHPPETDGCAFRTPPPQTPPAAVNDVKTTSTHASTNIKDRLGVVVNESTDSNHEPVNNGHVVGAAATKEIAENAVTASTPSVVKQNAAAQLVKKGQELLAAKQKLRKSQDEQRKEMQKMQSHLLKRKQELLEKQLAQQKVLIEKMEKLAPGPQRDLILDTIKKTQESIEEIKRDVAETVKYTQQKLLHGVSMTANNASLRSNKEDVQREVLDTELDLIAKQQEGADTSDIQRKLTILKMRLALLMSGSGRTALGSSSNRLSALSNGPATKLQTGGAATTVYGRRFNARHHLLTKNNLIPSSPNHGTGTTDAVKSLDHRPARLLISGYEEDEQDAVLEHFQTFGDIVDYAIDTTLPSITVNYKTRKDAEIALLRGKNFRDRTLSITWTMSVPTHTISLKKAERHSDNAQTNNHQTSPSTTYTASSPSYSPYDTITSSSSGPTASNTQKESIDVLKESDAFVISDNEEDGVKSMISERDEDDILLEGDEDGDENKMKVVHLRQKIPDSDAGGAILRSDGEDELPDGDMAILNEDQLLQDDEDDDEEERSWRR